MATVNGIQIIQDVPDIIYNAIIKVMGQYDRGDSNISATDLVKPAREWILKKEYYGQLKKLASLLVDALEGSALHYIIEQGATDDYVIEERAFKEIGGWKVSGKFDAYHIPTKKLTDWKRVSIWEYVFGVKPDKIQQLNILKYLNSGRYQVDILELGYVYKDWALSKALRSNGQDYPQKKIDFKTFDSMPDEEIEEMILNKLAVIDNYSHTNILPECTDEERWYRGEQWACMKKGRKSAVKVFKLDEDPDSMHKAIKYCRDEKLTVERRPGSYNRCQYCDVEGVCEQAREK
jgi:hypothetical protein